MASKEKIKPNNETDDKSESKGVGAGIAGAAALAAAALSADTNAVSSGEDIVDKENKPIIADDISAAAIIPATNVGDVEEAKSVEKSTESEGSAIGAAGVAGAAALAAAALTGDVNESPVVDAAKTEEPTATEVIAAATAVGAVGAGAGYVATEPKPIVAAPVNPTAVAVAAGGGGIWGGIPRWLFALLAAILLALLFWWLLRGCSSTPNEVPIGSAGEFSAPIVAVDSLERDNGTATSGEALTDAGLLTPESSTIEEPKVAAAETAAAAEYKLNATNIIGGVDCNCDTGKEPLFMRYAYVPKTLTKLGSNTEFGNSHALSPSEFYDKLNTAFYNSEVDRIFLDRIFRSMGYSAGWLAAKASMFSKTTVPYGKVGNIGYGTNHRTQYSELNLGNYDQQAFLIKSRNGCDIRFMKTCGNHMFYCTK
jgi:hypothetical protein